MSKQINAFRGSLDGYYQVEKADGSFGPVFSAGNLTNFDIAPDAEEIEVIDTGNANYGQAADSMIEAKPTKANFSINRFNIDNWALAFMAEISKRTASEQTVTDEVVSVVLGEMAKLANLDISALVINHTTGSPIYVLDTDYSMIDAELGIIKFLSAGSITDLSDVHTDYTAAAESGWLLEGGKKSSQFIKFWGRGINRFNNKRCIIKVPRGAVKPSGNFSVVGTDPAEIGMEMTLNVPTDGSASYSIIAGPHHAGHVRHGPC